VSPTSQRFGLQKSQRLTLAREFQAVYAARLKKMAGPLIVWARPNTLPRWRLGLSVGRRLGNAVVRNRAKRTVREAFRLVQHELPTHRGHGFDLVVSVRAAAGGKAPPALPGLAECQSHLLDAARAVHKEWEKREARRIAREEPHPE
jgi:ribonuclease P protein component